jgi:hypothetical protein
MRTSRSAAFFVLLWAVGVATAACSSDDAPNDLFAPFPSSGDREGGADARADAPTGVETACARPTLCKLRGAILHRYSFGGSGTRVTDSVGTAHAILVNAQLSGSGTVELLGGKTDQFVRLPSGIIRQLTNATFEVWLTWNGGGGWQRIFDFGNGSWGEGIQGQAQSSFHFTPQAMAVATYSGPQVLLAGFKRTDRSAVDELHLMASAPLLTGTMVHLPSSLTTTATK